MKKLVETKCEAAVKKSRLEKKLEKKLRQRMEKLGKNISVLETVH